MHRVTQARGQDQEPVGERPHGLGAVKSNWAASRRPAADDATGAVPSAVAPWARRRPGGWDAGSAGAWSPSGNRPMLSGERRTRKDSGTTTTRIPRPDKSAAVRQPNEATSRPSKGARTAPPSHCPPPQWTSPGSAGGGTTGSRPRGSRCYSRSENLRRAYRQKCT